MEDKKTETLAEKSKKVQKSVEVVGGNDYHKTAIVNTNGYEKGEKATVKVGEVSVEFEANGETQQIIKL